MPKPGVYAMIDASNGVKKQIEKDKNKPVEVKPETVTQTESVTDTVLKEDETKNNAVTKALESLEKATIESALAKEEAKVARKKAAEAKEKLNKAKAKAKEFSETNQGGRPLNKDKGIKSRKQYTLTLKEDTYKLILDKAGEEDLSFAKFMERAALEYIENH